MSEAVPGNLEFKTPGRPEVSSSEKEQRRSHSNDRRRSSSNSSRDNAAHHGRDHSNDRNEGKNRHDSGGNKHWNKDNRHRSSSGERNGEHHNVRSPPVGNGRGYGKSYNSSPQQGNYGGFGRGRGGGKWNSPEGNYGGFGRGRARGYWNSPEGNYDGFGRGRDGGNRNSPDSYGYNSSPNAGYHMNDADGSYCDPSEYSYDQQSYDTYGKGRHNQGSPQKRGRGRQDGYGGADFRNDGQTPGRNRQRWDEDPDVFLSKTLSSILRHNAERFGFKLMKGGFLYVDDILQYVKKLNGFTPDDVRRIVESNDKKRFSLENEEGRLKIRANQGHSIEVEDLELKPIQSADEVPIVIHGTYYSSWEYIRTTGLKRMNRNHIHFAAGEPGKNGVISGMRKTCEVMIHIDLEKALKAGLKFFLSANNVILSPGDENGVIYPCYFAGVVDRMNGYKLEFDHTISSAKIENEKPTEKNTESKKRKKKNKGKQNEDNEPKDGKEAKAETAKEQTPEKEVKEKEDEASTDDMSLPAAKKQHLSESAETEPPKAECFEVKKVEPEPTRNENDELGEDEVKSKNWREPVEVTTAEDSRGVVSGICANQPGHIVITCVGEKLGFDGSKIRLIIISCHPNSYVYHLKDDNRSLIKDGHLDQLFLDKNIPKVFHDIGAVSASLIHEFDILMNGVPIWDISILFGKVRLAQMDMEVLGFKEEMFKQWKKQNEEYGKKVSSSYDPDVVGKLYERGKLISDLYRRCIQKPDESLMKKVRAEIYKIAIPSKDSFLAQKVEALKLEMKGKKAAEKPVSQQPQKQQQHQQQQQGKSGKGKHGKGRKK